MFALAKNEVDSRMVLSLQHQDTKGDRCSDQRQTTSRLPGQLPWQCATNFWQRRVSRAYLARKITGVIVGALLVSIIGISQAAVAETKAQNADAAIFIQSLADQAIEFLSSPSESLRAREEGFRDILRDEVAMETIGRYVVGDYWGKMTAGQRKTYQKLFGEWLLKTYSVRLGGYSGESLRVVKTSKAGKRDVMVHTRIEKSAGDGFNADWRVRQMKGRNKIIDIYVDGVSMALTQRSEFDAVLRKRGIDGLIEVIRSRLTQLSLAS